jgi:glycosyltransferase involved in cell wall biosynthesis
VIKKHISVLIITKDRPRLLKNVLNQIRIQTFLPDELIIVENTKDNKYFTKDIIYKHIHRRIKVKYFEVKKNNYAISRNIALSNARSEIIIFLDDDVIITKNLFKKIIECYIEIPDAIGFGIKCIPYPANVYTELYVTLAANFNKINVKKPIKINYSPTFAITFKLNATKGINFDEKTITGEDTIFISNIVKKNNNFYFHPKLSAGHHFNNLNIFTFCKGFYRYANSYPYLSVVLKNHMDEPYYPNRKLEVFFFPIIIIYKCLIWSLGTQRELNIPYKYFLLVYLYQIVTFWGVISSDIGKKKLFTTILNIFSLK